VSFANRLDEAIHVDVDEIAKVVELVGRRRVSPVQHIDIAPSVSQIAHEGTIVLQIEHGPMADHRVHQQYGGWNTAWLVRGDPIERAAVQSADLLPRRLCDRDVLFTNRSKA